jgi:hypothetical protein
VKFPWDAAKPLRVEVALNPASEAPAWRDVSALVKGGSGVRITRGGGDRHEDVPPGRCTFTLDNRDGDYSDTSGMAPSLFRKRVRVSYRTPGVAGNLIDAENASFEGGTTGAWGTAYFGTPASVAIGNSAARASHGTKSLVITFPTATGGAGAACGGYDQTDLVIGRTHTAQCRVYVPVGVPAVRFGDPFGNTPTATSTVFGAWETLSITWASSGVAYLTVRSAGATTAGQQVWVDSFMIDEGATVGTFTTSPPPISYRFTGRIATNDLAFPALGLAETTLTATDESAWLGPSFSTLRSPIVEESLPDNPAGLWPLTEGNLGDVSTSGAGPMVISGSGDALSMSNDGATFAGGTWLKGALRGSIGTYLSPNVTLEATVTVDPATVTEGTVATISDVYGAKIALTVGADGKARARTWNVFTPGSWTASVISAQAINDATPHHLAATWNTGTGTLALLVDGVSSGSTVSTAGTGRIEAFGTHITAGGSTHSPTLTGTVSHVAAFSSVLSGARIAEHADGVLDGFTGETVAERIDRYNRWAGYPYPTITHIGTTAVVGNYDTDGKSLTDAINAVATVEDGLAYINGAGVLTIRGRSTLINTDPVFTIPGPTDGAANRVRGSLSYSTDPRTFVNDITGTMPGGITYRAVDADSVAEYGRTTDTVEGPFATVEDLAAVIEWRVRTESTPRPAVEGLSVRLSQLDDADTAALLALDLGDVIAWTGMPDQAPSATDSGVVLGIEETYTHADLLWTATSVSATSGLNVLIFDDPVRGVLDSTNVFGY